jgi:hypothetical protein
MHSRRQPNHEQAWVRGAKGRHRPTKIIRVLQLHLVEKLRQSVAPATSGIEYS